MISIIVYKSFRWKERVSRFRSVWYDENVYRNDYRCYCCCSCYYYDITHIILSLLLFLAASSLPLSVCLSHSWLALLTLLRRLLIDTHTHTHTCRSLDCTIIGIYDFTRLVYDTKPNRTEPSRIEMGRPSVQFKNPLVRPLAFNSFSLRSAIR